MTITIKEMLARWATDEGKPYKGSLIDRQAYESDPSNIGCMCAQGQVLHLIGGMTHEEIMDIENQYEADTKVMALLGIPRGQAILLRNINDNQDGAPEIVITHPEKVLGDNAKAVMAFFKYLDSLDARGWQKVAAAREAAWAAAWDAAGAAARDAAREAAWAAAREAAWAAAWDAAGAATRAAAWDAAGAATRAAAWDAAGAATRAAAWDAAGAANEIQGASIFEKACKPLFFLPLFGFETVQSLLDWEAAQ